MSCCLFQGKKGPTNESTCHRVPLGLTEALSHIRSSAAEKVDVLQYQYLDQIW